MSVPYRWLYTLSLCHIAPFHVLAAFCGADLGSEWLLLPRGVAGDGPTLPCNIWFEAD